MSYASAKLTTALPESNRSCIRQPCSTSSDTSTLRKKEQYVMISADVLNTYIGGCSAGLCDILAWLEEQAENSAITLVVDRQWHCYLTTRGVNTRTYVAILRSILSFVH
jgi:hypothetical protein